MRAWLSRGATVGALFLLTVAFYWKLTLTNQFEWMNGEDLGTQVSAWFQTEAAQWRSGHWPLWDPMLANGQPIIGQAQPGALYPLNWLLFASPARDGSLAPGWLRFYRVLIPWIALMLCFALCRDLGLSRAASLLGGAAFAFDGFVGTSGWPQWINGATWIPAVFLFLLRALRGRAPFANAVLCGAALGVSFLSGHHQIPMYLALAAAASWLGHRRWRECGITAAVAVMIGAVQLLPAMEFGRESVRWIHDGPPIGFDKPVPYSVHDSLSFDPRMILGFVIPSPPGHVDPHMGAVVVALAFLGFAVARARTATTLLGALALGAVIFAFGGYGLVHGVLYGLIPGLDKARHPSVALCLANFGVAVLAAIGLDTLADATPSPWARRVRDALVWLGALLAAGLTLFRHPEIWEQSAITLAAALVMAGILYGLASGAVSLRQARAVLVIAALIEFSNSTHLLVAPRSDVARNDRNDRMRGYGNIAGYLRLQPGPFRVMMTDQESPRNWGAWHGIEMWFGYLPAITANVAGLDIANRDVQSLYGVRFAVGTKPAPGFETMVHEADGMKLWLNHAAFPRAWAAVMAEQVKTRDEFHALVRADLPSFTFRAVTIGTPAPKLGGCAGENRVDIDRREPTLIDMTANMTCDGLVIVSETRYPGWEAVVDGRPAPILEVNGAMRAVQVPAGTHRVSMRYDPASVRYGLWITAAGLLIAAAAAFRA